MCGQFHGGRVIIKLMTQHFTQIFMFSSKESQTVSLQ